MRRAMLCVGFALVYGLLAADAGAVTDVIRMPRASRGVVEFTHSNHFGKYKIACEKCHHSTKTALSGITSCQDCHLSKDHKNLCHDCHLSNKERNYEERYQALKKKFKVEEVPTVYRAYHNMCRNCHIDENKAKGTKAPVECGGCHQ